MKEKIMNNIIYIIIILILIIYLAIVFIVSKKIEKKEEKLPYLVTDNSKYTYNKNKKFEKVEESIKYNWKDYDIYVDNKYIGNYKLQYNNKWYIYNEDRDSIKYEGNIIGLSNIDVKIYEFKRQDITQDEKNKINSYLKKEILYIDEYNTYESKIEFDIDNDGSKEKIYRVNSRINGNENSIFSIILMEKNGKFTKIVSNITSAQSNDIIKMYDVYGLIDINNDQTAEIIINENIYSQPDKSNEQIYRYNNKKFEKITN